MAENVKVIVRCRPVNKKEEDTKLKIIVRTENCAILLDNPTDRTAPSKVFTFDNAYDSKAPTEAIYNDICYSLVESVLEGYNGTIFAYGQTGCGKSHTMQGPSDFFDKQNKNERILSQRGIISRTFDHIFETISVTTDYRYLVQVSYLEIYNEMIRDLLNPNLSSCSLQLKELPDEGVFVQNLSKYVVQNSIDCEKYLNIGTKNRIIGSTLMNETSSRSHSIFTISLEQINDNLTLNEISIKKGKLNLVDLAGSERQQKTGATGERLKEATKINLSLSALGNVISALVDGKTKHIPYRDAKLTRLLQDSLGGNTRTLMIACISPSEYNYDETLSTLRYASRAKNIYNKPKINEDPKDTMLREYQEEINKLKKLLENNQRENTTKDIENEKPIENFEINERIKIIKNSLIGGENANNEKLKEKHFKKKIAAENRMIVLNELLKRIEQTEDRDLLKNHYTDIQQELIDKTENFKRQKQKIKSLEREICDLQSEFQLDRSDYLETIRRLEKNIKFYQQLIDKSLPVLRKDGRFWDIDLIKNQSIWNDDLQKWKFPDDSLTRIKLPPAVDLYRNGRESTSLTAPGRLERSASITSITSQTSDDITKIDENNFLIKKLQNSDGSIVESYFRPRRANELITQNRGFTSWKATTKNNWTNGGNLLLNRTWCTGNVSNQENLTQGNGSQSSFN